jgi:hypothetical protein
MSNSKISALTAATTPLAGTEILPVVQSSATTKVSVANLTAGRDVTALSLAAGSAASTQTISSTGIASSGSATDINIRLTPKGTAYAEVYASLNSFSATGQSILNLNNIGSTGQSPLDFTINTTLRGRIRVDFAGGVNYVSNGGNHNFFTGGDSGVGTTRFVIGTTGDVTNSTGNFVVATTAKGVTTGSAIPLGFGTNGSTTQAILDTSGNLGIGNTPSGTYKLEITGGISATGNAVLGSATTNTVTVNGNISIGTTPVTTVGVYAAHTALTGVAQRGFQSSPTGTFAATTRVVGFQASPATAATAFTSAAVAGFYATNPTKGAGSTITTAIGLYVEDITVGTNNYGFLSLITTSTPAELHQII